MGNSIAKAAAAAKSGFKYLDIPSNIKLFREESDTKINLDIIPYVVKNTSAHPDSKFIPEDIWWRYPFKLHRRIGPNNVDIICPQTVGKPCPICEERLEIYNDPNGNDELARELGASLRFLYIVIPKNHKKYPEEPHIWNISNFCFQGQLDKEIELGDDDCKNFADLENGKTLRVRFVEKKIGNQGFPIADRIDFKDRGDYDEDILNDLPCLDDCITIPTYEQVKAIFYGIDEENDEKSNVALNKEDEEMNSKKDDKKEKNRSSKKNNKGKELKCPEGNDFGEDYDEDDDDCTSCKLATKCEAKFNEINDKDNDAVNDDDEIDDEIDDEDDKINDEDNDAIDDDKEVNSKKSEPKKDNKKRKQKCPHGFKFGSVDDFDEHEECDDCDLYDDCEEKADE